MRGGIILKRQTYSQLSRPEVLEILSQTSIGKPLQTFHGNLSDTSMNRFEF